MNQRNKSSAHQKNIEMADIFSNTWSKIPQAIASEWIWKADHQKTIDAAVHFSEEVNLMMPQQFGESV